MSNDNVQRARAELEALLVGVPHVLGIGESADDSGNPVFIVFVEAGAEVPNLPEAVSGQRVRVMAIDRPVPD